VAVEPEVHLFVLWSAARVVEDEIVADIAARFPVLGDVEVTWQPGPAFRASLCRFYGDALPASVRKEALCGSGPLRVVAVDVRRPRYRYRRAGRRLLHVNAQVYDARARYRTWTGEGRQVHGSLDRVESARNLALLFGLREDDVRAGALRSRTAWGDLRGTGGWVDLAELELVLGTVVGATVLRCERGRLELAAHDVGWAELLLGGAVLPDGRRRVVVGGDELVVSLAQRPLPRPTVRERLRERLAAG
jgi:hypothetical protein